MTQQTPNYILNLWGLSRLQYQFANVPDEWMLNKCIKQQVVFSLFTQRWKQPSPTFRAHSPAVMCWWCPLLANKGTHQLCASWLCTGGVFGTYAQHFWKSKVRKLNYVLYMNLHVKGVFISGESKWLTKFLILFCKLQIHISNTALGTSSLLFLFLHSWTSRHSTETWDVSLWQSSLSQLYSINMVCIFYLKFFYHF